MRRCTALTYLFTYLHSSLGEYKTGSISETVVGRVIVIVNGLYKVVHGLSIAAKMHDLEWPLSEIQVIDSLNAAKMAKYT